MTAEENMSMHKLLERKSVHNSIIASIKAIMFGYPTRNKKYI
jgi:hypothetical protein